MNHRVLVLADPPDRVALAARFGALGWVAMAHLPAPTQQPADDCVLAGWTGPDGAFAQIVFDGLIHTLELHDAAPDLDATFAADALGRDAVLVQLGSLDPLLVLAGVRAAAAIADPAFAPALAPLRHHPDDAVRHEAAAAMQRLLPALLEAGQRWGGEQLRRRRGAQPLWDAAGPAWLRRQTLRWLLHDFGRSAPGLEATLRAALVDPDWEVRAGALIGAVRLRLRPLGALVEHCSLPTVSRNGPDASNRALLRVLRQVGSALLAGRTPPPPSADDAPARHTLARLAQWLSSDDAPHLDDPVGRLVHALTTPVEPGDTAMPPPPGVTDDGLGLHSAGRRLVVVPGARALPSFWIAREPVERDGAPLLLDAQAALAWCRQQSQGDNRWRLPTLAEWRRAAGADDGRLFPWGNGFQDDGPVTPGPWGTWGHGIAPEWAVGPVGEPLPCGPRLDQVGSDRTAAVRPVVA